MSSMGMDKSGTQTLASVNTWTKLTTFTVRSGYPSTVITNSTLVMNVAAIGNIRFLGTFNFVSGTQQFRVVKNGSTVLGSPANTGVTTTISAQTVAPGDTLELQAFASASFASTVSAGAASTFLEFNQTSQLFTAEGTQTVSWNGTSALAVSAPVQATQTILWNRTAGLNQSGAADGSQTISWTRTADLYQGIHYDIEAASNIGWTRTADLLHIPKIVSPPSIFSFADVSVSVHTVDGRIVGDFPCNVVAGFNWSREDTEVSTCDIDILTQGAPELVEELRQWVHWITVWHDETPVWTGPIQTIRITWARTSISARDTATLMWRTRLPVTRTFTDTAPARIADPLWRAMLQHHGVRATPIVLPGVSEDTFTVSAVADSRMLNQFMDELVKVGLHWTVIAGRPVLGVFSRDPVAELAECDFLVELERRRDGTSTFNDVRVQGQNWAQTAVVDLAGLRLQTIVSLDDMFGASNIQRATQQYARQSARLRDEIVVPPGASLHPQAPVTLDDLVPGKVFIVHTETVSQLMRLDQVTVSGSPDTFDVQVTLVALEDTGEIATLVGGNNQ